MDIYLHGLGQEPSVWDSIREKLNRDSQALNLYRLADSETEEEKLTYQGLYQGLCRYLDGHNSIDKLVGLSMGGILALNYALDYPNKVEELIISGAQYKIPNMLIRLQSGLFYFMPNRQFSELGISKADMISLMQSTLDFDLTQQLTHFTKPSKILIGNKDWANRSAAKKITQALPHAALFILEGGHELNLDNPDEFARIIGE